MLINLLVPPMGEMPEVTTVCSYATPGGGRLFIGVMAEEERINRWMHASSHEVWQTSEDKPSMRMHIYGCQRFEAFHEICICLANEKVGISQVVAFGEHTTVVLSGHANAEDLTRCLRPLSESLKIDIAVTNLPPSPILQQPGLLFMDMDSTLIQCECIDEIADFLGIKEKIASITQRAMEGELDFTTSLTERVKLLAGLDASILDQVYHERITLTDGAEKLIKTVHAHGWKVGLVSGGFTYFTDKLKDRLQLDYTQSNVLDIENGKLTGRILGDIVDAQAKRQALIKQAKLWNIPMQQTIAIGDGANDLPMLEVAELGIAFHAKPRVRELAPYALSTGGLDKILDLLR